MSDKQLPDDPAEFARFLTDDEKHEFCQKVSGQAAVFLPPSLYREAERQGYDMRYYVEQKPIPANEKIESHRRDTIFPLLGTVASRTSERRITKRGKSLVPREFSAF